MDIVGSKKTVLPKWRLRQDGETCLIIEFETQDIVLANHLVCSLAWQLSTEKLIGINDIVPTMVTVALHYHPALVRQSFGYAEFLQLITNRVNTFVTEYDCEAVTDARRVVLPVCYGGAYGEDLEHVAQACNLSTDEVIHLHSSSPVRVLMLGFAPGHPYIGMFDQRLGAVGRRTTPRTVVPIGSIGLANCQSVIYPMALPGGWNLIGRIPLPLFNPIQQPHCLLSPGDEIEFQSITSEEFIAIENNSMAE